jgi:hypothetical protein
MAADLLDPYLEDLDGMLKDPRVSFRESIMTMLAAAQPRISSKAAAMLVAHPDDSAIWAMDAGSIVYGLLFNFPSDPTMIHQVLNFAGKSSEPGVSSNAVKGLNS